VTLSVCAPSSSASGPVDPLGNTCNWYNCGLDTSSPNEFFGGCSGNFTAGTLCCPKQGCADGTVEQAFRNGVVGCAGVVNFGARASLCNASLGCTPCSAAQWIAQYGGQAPTHHYWTNDDLLYAGLDSGNCWATLDQLSGSTCQGGSPMRVCTDSGVDPEGSRCNWTGCGFDAASPSYHFGGCDDNLTSGTLCCCP